MQLTRFTDYALRILIYLAAHDEERVPLARISSSYGISHDHLVKATQRLVELGLVDARRGRHGGLSLARKAAEISVGEVVRGTEPTMDLLDCFAEGTDDCVIAAPCRLKRSLAEALDAFLAVLDEASIEEMAKPASKLRHLLEED